jgi:hypothetical protein
MIPSVRGRQCSLHWVAAAAFVELSAAWTADTGKSGLVACSGHRGARWKDYAAYEANCLRRYAHRLPDGSSRAQVLRYARRYLAYHSLHQTGLAVDLRCHGLHPDSSTIEEQRATELHLWLDEHAEEWGWVRYVEPWHIEKFIEVDVWEMDGPEG